MSYDENKISDQMDGGLHEQCTIHDVRERSISWWNELGGNPLLRMIKQGELTNKYYGQMRKTSSLTDREIENIYVSENVV